MDTTLQPKKPWLTDDEKTRVAELSRMRALYEGRHRELFFTGKLSHHNYKPIGVDARNVLYLTENWPGRCILKYADLLYGEPLAIAPADDSLPGLQEAIDRVLAKGQIHPVLYQAAVESAWAGSAWIQPLIRAGTLAYETVPPEHVFPSYELGTRRLLRATIKYRVTIDGAPCVRVIDHRVEGGRGVIVQELWRLDDKDSDTVVSQMDLALLGPGIQPAQPTGLSEPAIVEIANYSTGGLGKSDFFPFDDVAALADEVNNRRTQISRILDTHGDPAVEYAEKLLDAAGNLAISGKAIPNNDMAQPVIRYVTWEAQLEHAFTALVSATHALIGHFEMAPMLVGLGGGGTSADTWKKFKLQVSQTLARVNRKQIFVEPQIQKLINMALLLDVAFAAAPAFVPGEVELTWSDGLPVDDEELQRLVTGYVDARLMSRKTAMVWIHGDWTDQQIDDELAAIDADTEARMPTAFRNGALALDDGPADPRGDPDPDVAP